MDSYNTNSSIDSILDELLSKSRRLEKVNSSSSNLPFPSILTSSRTLFSSNGYSNEDIIQGQYLLGNTISSKSNVFKLLKDINPKLNYQITNFHENINNIFQENIIKSLKKSKKKTDKLFQKFMDENSKNIEEEDIILPINEFIESPKSNFYLSSLKYQGNKFSEYLSDNIRTNIIFSGVYQIPLADIFLLIYLISNSKTLEIGVLKFLEQQMKGILINELNNNLILANRGGRIGFIPSIKGYLNIINHPQNTSPWAIIYYSLRCGDIDSALEYITTEVNEFDQIIINALQMKKLNTPLTGILKNSILSYYQNELISSSRDSFKTLTLSILSNTGGFIDDSIIVTFEDWFWFKLQLLTPIKEISEELKNVEFDDISNPFMKGQVLIMINNFIEAANLFLKPSSYYEDTFHIALSLHTSGLIHYSIIEKHLIKKSIELYLNYLNYSLNYLIMINNTEDKIKILTQFLIKIPNINLIFEPNDNNQIPISLYLSPKEQQLLIYESAKLFENLNQFDKCNYLYHLINEDNKIVQLYCQKLKHFVDGSINSSIIFKTETFLNEIYNYNISQDNFELIKLLFIISKAIYLEKENNFNEAAILFDKSDLIPSNFSQINEYKNKINNSSNLIKSIMPNILFSTAKSYSEIMKNLHKDDKGRLIMIEKSQIIIEFSSVLDIEINEFIQKKLLNLNRSIK